MRAIFLIAFLFTSVAFGKQQRTPPQTLTDGNWSGNNNLYIKLIPYGAGVGFAGNYEKSIGSNLGIGGGITVLPEKDETSAPAYSVPKLISVGANLYYHMPVDFMDFYVAPGLNVMIMEVGTEDETTLGGSLAIGALAQFTKSFALGLEVSTQQSWFNKETYALSRNYFFLSAITAKFTF